MKKLVSILILCASLLVILTSCNGKKNESENKVSTDVKEGKAVIWTGEQSANALKKAIEIYRKENPDSKIDFDIQIVSGRGEKLGTMFMAGAKTGLPDVVKLGNDEVQVYLEQFKGKFANLSALGVDKYQKDYSKGHWDLFVKDGSSYAFPFDIAPIMMRVNTEMFEKAGVDWKNIVTWDDYIQAGKKIEETGFSMGKQADSTFLYSIAHSHGVNIFDENGNIDLLNPKWNEAVKKYMELAQSKTLNSDLGAEAFSPGETATDLAAAWVVGEGLSGGMTLKGKERVVRFPQLNDGDKRSNWSGGSAYLITEDSNFKDELYKVFEIHISNMEVQKTALEGGLLTGCLPAGNEPWLNEPLEEYGGQKIWREFLDTMADAPQINIFPEMSKAQTVLQGVIIDKAKINDFNGKSSEELLKEAAEQLAAQTKKEINQY